MVLNTNVDLYGQGIRTVSADFRRQYHQGKTEEETGGKLYYQSPNSVFLKVEYPIVQWMILREKETLIYYPAEKKAFRILAENPLLLPFFGIFLRVLKEDFGLAELGYTFKSYEKEKDALLSYWAPPKNLSKILGEVLLKFQDNRIISVESKNSQGEIFVKIFLDDYILQGRFNLPMQILVLQTLPSFSSEERIFFKNAQFDVSLPEEILSFRIPEGVEVKEIKW